MIKQFDRLQNLPLSLFVQHLQLFEVSFGINDATIHLLSHSLYVALSDRQALPLWHLTFPQVNR